MAAPPGAGDRRTTTAVTNRKALDTGERLSIYGLDLDNIRFDTSEKTVNRGSVQIADQSVASMWVKKGGAPKQVETVDGSDMFGNFEITVNSTAKPGTELGFEFKALLDNDLNFELEDYTVALDANSIVFSGVSQCWECQASISDSTQGVTAFGRAYHRHCVKCAATGKDFTGGGNAFEGEDGKVYCEAEWIKRYQRNCGTCRKPIKEKNPVVAKLPSKDAAGGDKILYYHRKCFVCGTCNKLLEGRWVPSENGAISCENCFFRSKGLTCPCCDLHVDGAGHTIGKFKFHQKCYFCSYCRREPDGYPRRVARKPNRIYCGNCAARIFKNEALNLGEG